VHCINAAAHHPIEVSIMINRIEQLADNLKAESRLLADRAVANLRAASLETAGFLSRTKAPVHTFADTGLKLNNLSHKGIEKLLKQQVAALEDLIDGSARRLEMAARAKSVKSLVDEQIATLPKSRDQAVANAKKTVAIVRETGDALGGVLKGVVVEISSARPAARPAVRRGPGRPAGKKKAAARKPAAGKRVAKKAVARKAPARRKAAPAAARAA
jgi:hypothetical protein